MPAKRPAAQPQLPRRSQAADISNVLLSALPMDDLRRLRRSLEIVPLPVKQFIHRPGERIDYVFFPGDGFCSELTLLENGAMIEVATIGCEGMIGLAAGSDTGVAHSVAMIQAAMETSYRLPADDYRAEMNRGGAFHALMTRYMHAHVGAIMQSTACNAVHTVEQRLARWLLMAHDRIDRREFSLTQEFIAMMLGVARPTVTIVAGTLQKAGLITYHRGRIEIVDRDKLESAACECYRVATDLLRSVTSPPPRVRTVNLINVLG